MQLQMEQTGPTTSQASIRTHTVTIDRPVEKGGSDRGPQGGELLLASLGGCFLSNVFAAAKARSADVSDVHLTLVAMVGGVPERVEAIAMHVRARCEDRALLQKLLDVAERGCLVTNTLKSAAAISVTLEN